MQKNEQQRQLDEQWMAQALALAEKGKEAVYPNPMVGAVIVKENQLIGEGYHSAYGKAHAEIEALRHCQESAQGATLYVTLEPCCHYGKTPPCTEAILTAGISRVVIGMIDPNPLVAGKGADCLWQSGVEVVTGVMEKDCQALNTAFIHYVAYQRPEVILKAAMSLDGKIATRCGESQWITGEAARQKGHETRAEVKAILVGIGTVLADDPLLTCRSIEKAKKQSTRIVLDKGLDLPMGTQLVQTANEVPLWVVTTPELCETEKAKQLEAIGVRLWPMPLTHEHFDWHTLLKAFSQAGVDSLLIEGGGRVHDSALRAGVVDMVHFYIAPMLIGGASAKSAVDGLGVAQLSSAVQLTAVEVSFLGSDLFYKGKVLKPGDKFIEGGHADHVYGDC